MAKDSKCGHCEHKQPFYKDKLFIVSAVLAALVALSYFIPLLIPFREAFFMYLGKIWWAILLGLAIGGLIDYYVPREYISLILASPEKKTIFYSVILGFFMSTCSHGILALAIQLHKKGASTPAVIAFLLASPWANMALTIMLIGFFGLKALYIIFSAILIAIITGFIYQFLDNRGLIEKNPNIAKVEKGFSITEDIKKRFRSYKVTLPGLGEDVIGIYRGAASLAGMVLWWIFIGMALASLAGAYIPSHIFTSYMGPTFLGLLVTLAVATVIEVCSEGSSPLAFEIFRQTGAFGNSLVFLMAGVATDYTEIGLIWHNVGRRAAIWLPIITVPQILILGFLANILF
ncbi:MAG: permease [Candidatus Omnitrophica bacterium]|nr:permease [Candidatus Omnitrophota bacterium]MBU4487913.1 permease [Candidatus Omnitrophota bacterium]MCG2705620.1 permease [Candidatus Omnitrophota bacterium]